MLLCLSMRRIMTDFGPEALFPSHLNLLTLTFDYTITTSQLRAILVVFPVLRSLSIQRTLQPFSALDRLEVLGAWLMVGPEISEEDDPGYEFMPFPLTMIICPGCTQFAANSLALWFHFVIRLDLGGITTKVLVAITTTCGELEHARFELKEKYSQELCLFLAACSRPKECLRYGHVAGLSILRREGRSIPKTLTEEMALEQLENSYSIQKLVHAKLARHKSLLEIKFGPGRNPDACCATATLMEPTLSCERDLILRGFNFSWASGFGQVVSLLKLQLIEISGTFAVFTMWGYR
ncbi:hypothetical protein BG015_004389 [Linnemannia schmuckeri]|uniref:Uncharacterized protein n=1 Tax=Linnemannia schmuckeri TaxID=64567 RepID=A0A9P5S1L4_9FUNG|nr:hypothetical protein BG015_004389 [Linnemannia schmuckeri]